MELLTSVMVRQNVRVEKRSLRGMRGIVVDRPGPDARPEIGLVFVRFPPTHLRDEFFAWVRERDLEVLQEPPPPACSCPLAGEHPTPPAEATIDPLCPIHGCNMPSLDLPSPDGTLD